MQQGKAPVEINFPWLEFGEILVATVLGGLIGLDRELRERPAGLRTHMLVAMSAAMFVTLAETLIHIDVERDLVRADPLRIVEAIATVVAFLGAGTIFRSRDGGAVKGLTTAASILFVAALGVAAALNLWLLAISSTLFVLVVLRTVGVWESWLHRKRAQLRSRTPRNRTNNIGERAARGDSEKHRRGPVQARPPPRA